jgi:hypothetical protein
MSDDLVERLRQPWDTDRSIMSQTGRWMTEREDAAARIEELQARAEAAEAKLAKAVEAFTRIDDLTCHNMPMTAREEQAVNREARAALAELKGQTDE